MNRVCVHHSGQGQVDVLLLPRWPGPRTLTLWSPQLHTRYPVGAPMPEGGSAHGVDGWSAWVGGWVGGWLRSCMPLEMRQHIRSSHNAHNQPHGGGYMSEKGAARLLCTFRHKEERQTCGARRCWCYLHPHRVSHLQLVAAARPAPRSR
jgi:hypothetical protein